MNTIKKIYFAVPNGEVKDYKGEAVKCTHLRCEVYYSKGGYNGFTGKQEQRGYYASVSPVKCEGMFESYTAFTGCKSCILPCARQGKKLEAEAVAIFQRDTLPMIKQIYSNNGIDFDAPVAA
jgi:hypothetical protein